MGLFARIDDYFYERRERRKREFIARMENVAEQHRQFQEGRSKAYKLWEQRMREKRAQEQKMEVIERQREYIANLERDLEIANRTVEKLSERVQELHIEMEQVRQQAGLSAHEIGNPDRARISGEPV